MEADLGDRIRWRVARPRLVMAASLAAGLMAAGCGDDGSDGELDDHEGAALYEQSCASCHGSDLRGTNAGPSHLSEVYEPGHHSDESFRVAIEQGVVAHHWDFGNMPPVPGLEDDEVDAIIAYIRDQQETHGLEPYPPG